MLDNLEIQERKDFIISRSYQEDVALEEYHIQLESPVNELSNEFSKYYIAVNKNTKQEYFAIVFERTFNPIKVLGLLQNAKNYNCICPIGYEIVKLSTSKASYLVAIVEKYNPHNTLTNWVRNNGPVNASVIEQELINPIISILKFCAKHNVCCGNINSDNILVLDNGTFVLREFFNALPNFYQPNHYLAPELLGCVQYGRIQDDNASDIYALAILSYCSMTKQCPWDGISELKYNFSRLKKGSFKLLMSEQKVACRLNTKKMLRTMMSHEKSVRCQILMGSITKAKQMDGSTPIIFNNYIYSNFLSLSYAFHQSWDIAAAFLKEEDFKRWLQRGETSSTAIQNISKILKDNQVGTSLFRNYNAGDYDLLTQVLLILNEGEVIRINGDFAITTPSIPTALLYNFISEQQDNLQDTLKIINEASQNNFIWAFVGLF